MNPEELQQWLLRVDACFSAQPELWQRLGKTKPTVCQFHLVGEKPQDWYCGVDADGARLRTGSHPSPQVTWSSSMSGFGQALRGIRAPDVKIEGDVQALSMFLDVLGQAIPPEQGAS